MSATVLIVEDHADHREYLRYVFVGLGFRVLLASRVFEVNDIARRQRPDLILLDVVLNEGDGRIAARQLKDAPETANIPILAVTGLTLAGEREKCLAAGCDAYLSKPFTPKELRDKVVQVLEQHRTALRDAPPGAQDRDQRHAGRSSWRLLRSLWTS